MASDYQGLGTPGGHPYLATKPAAYSVLDSIRAVQADANLKIGKPVARQARESGKTYVVSECPLAGEHILQGIENLEAGAKRPVEHAPHPIELMARAYGL